MAFAFLTLPSRSSIETRDLGEHQDKRALVFWRFQDLICLKSQRKAYHDCMSHWFRAHAIVMSSARNPPLHHQIDFLFLKLCFLSVSLACKFNCWLKQLALSPKLVMFNIWLLKIQFSRNFSFLPPKTSLSNKSFSFGSFQRRKCVGCDFATRNHVALIQFSRYSEKRSPYSTLMQSYCVFVLELR